MSLPPSPGSESGGLLSPSLDGGAQGSVVSSLDEEPVEVEPTSAADDDPSTSLERMLQAFLTDEEG